MIALFALVGCSKSDGVESSQSGELRITSSITTRASGTSWDKDDEIGVYMAESGTTIYIGKENTLYTPTSGGSNVDFESDSPLYYPTSGYVDILAYYPYSDTEEFDVTAYEVDVTDQSELTEIDLMIATKSGIASTSQALALNFEHKLSQINLTIKLSDGTDLDLSEMSVKLIGTSATATYDLTADDSSPISNLCTTSEIALLTNSDGTSCEAIVIPQSLSGAMLLFDFKSGESLAATITTTSFAIGQSYNYTATLSYAKVDLSSAVIGEWVEGNGEDGESLTASPVPLYSYVEFKRNESNPANMTKVDTAGAIENLLSQFRRCLMYSDGTSGEATICYLNDSNSNFYYDGAEINLEIITNADVMVYFPEYWYKYENVDNDYFRYHFSEWEMDGYIRVEASLVGAYKAYNENNMVYSRSGVTPTVSVSQVNFIKYAAARGIGYQIIDYDQNCTIAMMLYASYLDRNLQTHIGVGSAQRSDSSNSGKPTITGSTNSLGNTDTNSTATGYVNGLGIEGVFGGVYEWVQGITISDRIWTIPNPTNSEDVRTVTAGNVSGYITNMALEGYSNSGVGSSTSTTQYFDMVPTATSSGSYLTYYADYYFQDVSTFAFARSDYDSSDGGGIACSNANQLTTTENSGYGSRLAFRGTISEATNVSDFVNKITE